MSATVSPCDDLPSSPEEICGYIPDWKRRGRILIRLCHQYHELRAVVPAWQAPVERLGNPWAITRHADAASVVHNTSLVKDERVIGFSGVGARGAFMEMLERQFAFQGSRSSAAQ